MVDMPSSPALRRHRFVLAAAVTAGLTLPGIAYAQSAPATPPTDGQKKVVPPEEAQPLQPLVVTDTAEDSKAAPESYQPVRTGTATLTDTPIIDIPQAVNVVPEQALKDQKATTLDDALRNVSNIQQTNTLGGTQDAVLKRGFGENRDGSIMTNGMRTVLPRSFNATTESVEVLKGPSSTLYGILDPGGMINVVTKKPEQDFGGSVSGTGSTFGGGSGEFDVTGPIADTGLAYRFISSYENVDYWRNFGNTERWLVSPSLTWFGEDTTVNVSYMHTDYSVPFDRGTIFDLNTGDPVDVSRKTRFDEKYNITDGRSDLAQLDIEHEIDKDWTARLNYSFSQDKYSDNQARVIAYNAATGNLTRRADATDGSTQRQHSVRADLQGNIDVAGFENELLVGVAYDNYDLLRTNMIRCPNVGGFNIYDPNYGNLPKCTTVSAVDSDQTIQQETYSAYLQDAFHIDDQWTLIGGLRYQYYEQYAGKGRPFIVNTDAQDDKIVPRAGIVYKALPELSLYANYSESFTPQTSIASYVGALPPEEGVSYEVGAKFDILDGITGNIAFFHTDKENVLYTETINGESVAKTAGKVRSRGIELDISGQITEDLSVIASYGFTDAEIMEDPDYRGNTPVNVPKHTGSLFLAYDVGEVWGRDRFRFGGGVRAVSKRPGNQANTYDLPGYAVVDAFAAYTLDFEQPLTLQLNLKNLFDKTYYTSSIGTNNLGNQIGEPFQALLTLRADF